MALARFGSNYWVVRSDPSLWSANRDLVIRVMPEGFCPSRITASAIAYSQQDVGGQPDSLWNHPEWAQLVVAPKWIKVGIGVEQDPLELVVPNFGQTHKAALVVITAGDSTDAMDDSYVLPYRLNLTLRVAPFQSPNPDTVTTYAAPYTGWTSTWSPAGDELAFVRTDATSGPDQVYRVPVLGGTPTILFPQPWDQFYPDWSPRGDWVSLDQATGGGSCDIWVVNPLDGQSRQLTSTADHDYAAVFSPNGQQLVYLREISGPPRIQLRRVNVDGSNDTLLWDRTGVGVHPPRWAPNGPRVYIALHTPAESLYAIDAVGPQRGTVTAIAQLPPKGAHFDPPRGTGRWVWEVEWQPPGCGSVTSRRLALRDSPTDPSDETVFGRPTSTFTRPRWSWDGTRIVYNRSQPYEGVPANVFVAQVSYNHAPSFVGLSDQTVSSGQAFELDLTATDPDGESLTYEAPAVFLPPGASFDPNTRRFTWPNPPLPGTDYYFVVFRALDPSGAVAHRVIRLEVQGPGGGCPFLDSRTAAGWQEENSVLGRSLTDALSLDGYRLKHSPHVVNGRVSVRVRENEQEHSVLDHVRMVAVDHAPDVRAYSIGDRVFLGTRVPAHRVTTSDGRDLTALVSGSDGHYLGFPGDTLLVEMSAPRGMGTFGAHAAQDGGGGEGGLEGDPGEMEKEYRAPDILARRASPMSGSAVDADVLAYTGIVVEVPDGAQGWRTLTHYYPRRYRWETVMDSLGSGPCRLIFIGRHRLSFIGRYLRAATSATPQALTLLTAQHSRLGDRKAAVSQSAGATTTLTPGDTLTLAFATTAAPAGQTRDYFLFTTGVYSAIAPLAQGRESDSETAPRPTRFVLAQNQPNPFERMTSIRFELPREIMVRLEVFDLLGRRIAVLADGPLPAGYHAADWDRRDVRGILARPGVYLYRLTAGDFRETRKLLLSR